MFALRDVGGPGDALAATVRMKELAQSLDMTVEAKFGTVRA